MTECHDLRDFYLSCPCSSSNLFLCEPKGNYIMVNVIEYIFPPDRDELKLALDRVFKFVINEEKKPGNEEGRETKLVFFDLDTGQKEIREYFEPKIFNGEIDAYHVLLTLHNPPLNNDHRDYAKIKLFLDYLDKNQLGWKISYFDCVKNLSDLLKNGNLKKPVNRSYEDTSGMFYEALQASFTDNMEAEKIIERFKQLSAISISDPQEIFFECNQGNEMGSDLDLHKMLRNFEQALQGFFDTYCAETSGTMNPNNDQNKHHPLKIAYQNRFVTLCRDIGGNLVEDVFNWNNESDGSGKFNVLIIDDNYATFKKQIKAVHKYTNLRFYQLQYDESWEDFYKSLRAYNQARIKDTANHFALFARRNDKWNDENDAEVEKIYEFPEMEYFKVLIDSINKIQTTPMVDEASAGNGNELSLEEFDFFLVDLQFGEHKIGDRIVRYLKRLLEDHGKRRPILILSLSDDSMDIQRCLNEGAKGYIYKERIFSIPYRLKELYEEKTSSPSAAHSQNFRSLYQLPHPIIDRLKREQITGNKIDHEWIDHEYEWIDCLPKADLHVHLGGSMPADLIADLAFNHLLNMVYQKVEPAKGKPLYVRDINKALRELKIKGVLKKINKGIQLSEEKQLHSVDKSIVKEIKRILQQINKTQKEKTMPFPNREICDVAGQTSPLKQFLEKMEPEGLAWDYKLCIFLVWLAYKNGYDPSRRWGTGGFYYKLIDEVVRKHYSNKENIYRYSDQQKDKIEQSFDKYLENKYEKILIRIKNIFNGTEIGGKRENPVYDLYDPDNPDGCCPLIKQLLNAANKDSSLIGYLRGCEISGSELQKSFESIIIAAFRIGLEASLNRIRYMELRCSPDGFLLPLSQDELTTCSLKYFISRDVDTLIFDMKSPESVLEDDLEKYKRGRHYQVLATLLWAYGQEFQQCAMEMAYDFLKKEAPQNVSISEENFVAPRIAILISAKRHKDLGKIKDQIQMYEMYKKHFSERTEYAPILGFDLAGAEKGFPPSVFSDVMTPLFEECINMTIHAGEETDWLYIWQSIYKLHAARIGHGLTLGNDLNLLHLAKEKKICIEMCPKSNTLTNKYSTKDFHEDFHSNKTNYEQLLETIRNDIRLHGRLQEKRYEGIKKILFPEKRSKEPPYPLRFYYDFGLPVAICTDNPCVSNASMTEEYMEACRRSGGFSKWDILRIIKMGFKNAFLPKEEVARMLQRVGNEIYDKVLELEKIEKDLIDLR